MSNGAIRFSAARMGLESLRYRESVIDEYTSRRDPLPFRKDMFAARPVMVEIRRATLFDHRRGFFR